jgi:phytanoyl-CoA hydroxylase
MQTVTSPAPAGQNETPALPDFGFATPHRRAFASWPAQGRPPGYYRLPLPPEALEFYREQGFLVVEDCLGPVEVAELRAETVSICRGDRGAYGGLTPTAPGESDDDVLKRYLCIHFPHKISDAMRGYVAHAAYREVLTGLIGPNVKCMQSMLFIKASGKPGQAWHQDEFFIPTRDRSLTGGWVAMDDATVENGCLWIHPGSHKTGILWPQRSNSEAVRDDRFDCTGIAHSFPWRDEDSVPVEVKAGSIVFFNGYLLHRSLPNYSTNAFRRVLVNHYMSAESLLPWRLPRENESMATCDDRDILMIAGTDPYAWKPVESRHAAFVRRSGEGGCVDSNTRIPGAQPEPADPPAMGGAMGGASMGGSDARMG